MANSNDDATACADAVAFLDRLLGACGQRVDDLDVPIDELRIVTLDDLDADPDAVLRQPGERVRLARLAAKHLPAAERECIDGIDPLDVRAWSKLPSDGVRHRFLAAFVALVQELRHRVLATVEGEPWLLIDDAARGAGESTSRVRKGAMQRKRNPLPVLLDDDGKPAKPLRARVSDVRAWAAKSREAKEIAATKAAIPGRREARRSQGRRQNVEGGHGNPN